MGAGFAVVLIGPCRAAQFRRSESRKAKTDRIDARALARFLAQQPTERLAHPELQFGPLCELTRFRAEFVQQRIGLLQRLRSTLDLDSLVAPSAASLLIALCDSE